MYALLRKGVRKMLSFVVHGKQLHECKKTCQTCYVLALVESDMNLVTVSTHTNANA